MESEADFEGETETPVGAGDVEEGKGPESAPEVGKEGEQTAVVEGEAGEVGEGAEGETGKITGTEEVAGEHVEGEHVEGEHVEGEHAEGEHAEGEHAVGEHIEGEQVEGEKVEGEHHEGETVEGEGVEGEHVEGEQVEGEAKEKAEGEELEGEGLEGEQKEGEEAEKSPEDELLPPPPEEVVEEDEYEPDPPPDPAAPYDFSDSKEALKAPFELRPDQLAEVEQLWEVYQNYTPAYADLDGYVTEKELIYMLKSLLVMTYTVEQLHELITYCCRPPHPKGHIFYDQFLKMVTIRQRDFPIEEEIRAALQFFDPEKQGLLDRENMREVLTKQGQKMVPKLVDNLIKEVDMSNDGTIGIEDIVGTMCIDLNEEDMQMLRNAVYPPKQVEAVESELDDF
ncbi:hypothetical protein PYW08_015490 [Mythimna loreyi]|uniref:Uncharacterized protein n=1 Tax=Mythimna loreyi TaxID=667449 RepID=A0ACC2QWS5_9NEOP|nr:hypothetical protein PYW08_015490 [Mythimna loreyi]